MQKNNSDENKKVLALQRNKNILGNGTNENFSNTEPKERKEIELKDCKRLQRSVSLRDRCSFKNKSMNQTHLAKHSEVQKIQKCFLERSLSERPKKTCYKQIIFENKDKKIKFEESITNTNIESSDYESENDESLIEQSRNYFKAQLDNNLELKSQEDDDSQTTLEFFIRHLIDSDSELDFENFFDLDDDNLLNTGFYEKTLPSRTECEICFDFCLVNERQCCSFKSCNNCINLYIQNKIKESCGNLSIECLNDKCKKLIQKDEICERMLKFDSNTHDLYSNLLVNANKNSNMKTCPRCSHILEVNSLQFLTNTSYRNSKSRTKSLTKCQCTKCELIWCFQCHAPWHEGISCSEFKKGDRMLKYWAKEVHYGQQNAQICPKCKIYIQRTKGCDHMICSNCHSGFCYSCGKRFRSIKFIGDHYSKLSVLGCKNKLYPEKPFKRRAIRGSILGAKIAATPFVIAIGLVVGVGVVAAGTVALPVYGSYKLYKYSKLKRKAKKKSFDLPSKNLNKKNPSVSKFYSDNIHKEQNHYNELDLEN